MVKIDSSHFNILYDCELIYIYVLFEIYFFIYLFGGIKYFTERFLMLNF